MLGLFTLWCFGIEKKKQKTKTLNPTGVKKRMRGLISCKTEPKILRRRPCRDDSKTNTKDKVNIRMKGN